jgi:nitrile hydratase subunit beta
MLHKSHHDHERIRCGERTVSRVHDVGGQSGFGPVSAGDGGRPFHADWEARVWALSSVLRQRQVYSLDEFRDAAERIPPQEHLASSSYERWLRAMEMLPGEKGVA